MLDEADRDVLKTLTVLYVEDDAETVTQARRYLQPRVGSLLTAEDGGEALQLFEQHRPDIVATDIRIPGPDGLEITENIRERSPSTPVILITAFESTDYLRRAVNAGVEQ